MTPFTTLNRRLGILAMAFAYTSILFGAALAPAPAEARTAAPYYVAELAAPAAEARVVAGGVAWNCAGTTCVAAKGNSRPLRICRSIKREFGEVISFSAKGKELDQKKLATCNGK